MKRILITGANSYIGTSFENYMKQFGEYKIDTLNMLDSQWKNYDFSKYDVVFHVAGIAHQKETKENAHLYYEINRDLAVEVAKKAKSENVKQFIFMSSMSVYGLISYDGYINADTVCKPSTAYGKSKLEAENSIMQLATDWFTVSILRPPMVYGDNSPGNLTKLFKLVRKIHIFPDINNQRSSISIEMLCKYIKDVIGYPYSRIYLPQNIQYMCTSQIVKEQMKKENTRVLFISILNPLIKMLIGRSGIITKMFGDLKYEK